MQADGWIRQRNGDNETVTFDPNINTIEEAVNANYENVTAVETSGTVEGMYDLNEDGTVTSQVILLMNLNFTTEGGTTINPLIKPLNMSPEPGSGRIDSMEFSSPFFLWSPVSILGKYIGKAWTNAFGNTAKVLPNSGPVLKTVGAASRADMLAKKLKMNVNSPTSRQVLNSLDETVDSFISTYRKPSVRSEIPGEFLNQTVEEALKSGNTTVRKLLTDGRFVK